MSQGRYGNTLPPTLFLADLKKAQDLKAEPEIEKDFPALYKCPISLTIMSRPMTILPCKHIAEESNIKEWMKINSICPCCRAEINSLVLNDDLKEVIDHYQQEQKEKQLQEKAHKERLEILFKENKKLAIENFSLKTALTHSNKDSKHNLYTLLDVNAHGLVSAQSSIEKTVALVKARLIAAKFMKIVYKQQIKRRFKKLASEVSKKKVYHAKLKTELDSNNKKLQAEHLKLTKEFDLENKDNKIIPVESSKLHFQKLQKSLTDWSAACVNAQTEQNKLTREHGSLNEIAKRLKKCASKRFLELNNTISTLSTEIQDLKKHKLTILKSSLEYANLNIQKAPSFFHGNKDHTSLEEQLFSAIQTNADFKIIWNLLSKGVNPNVVNLLKTDETLYPPIYLVINNPRVDILNLLLQVGADANFRSKERWGGTRLGNTTMFHPGNMTPLMFAVKIHHCQNVNPQYKIEIPKIIDLLLSKNALINVFDNQGMTALHWAVHYKDNAMVMHLLAKNADPKIKNQDGKNVLEYAKTQKCSVTIEEILTQAMEGKAAPALAVNLAI